MGNFLLRFIGKFSLIYQKTINVNLLMV